MISEVTFAHDFSSFWRTTTPNMEGFVRRQNNGAYDRDYEPMNARTASNRRSFVNEIAFEMFCNAINGRQRGKTKRPLNDHLQVAVEMVRTAAGRLTRDGDYDTDLSVDEIEDVREQVTRLMQRLSPAGSGETIVLNPAFLGCGFIDSCQGDVLVGSTLFEIKAGDRPFRSIDVRQLLTYLALNYTRQSYVIRSVGLVNPRVGISTEIEVGELCFQVSGRDYAGLLGAIIYAISSGEISR